MQTGRVLATYVPAQSSYSPVRSGSYPSKTAPYVMRCS